MADLSLPSRDSVAAQRELFRQAEVDHSLSIPVLHKRNRHLRVSTMKGWRDGAVMPVWALGELKTAGVPDDLLSLVLEPFAVSFVSDPDGDEGDLDTAAQEALDFASEVHRARHPKSPGGTAIVPQEKSIIMPKRRRAAAALRRARA